MTITIIARASIAPRDLLEDILQRQRPPGGFQRLRERETESVRRHRESVSRHCEQEPPSRAGAGGPENHKTIDQKSLITSSSSSSSSLVGGGAPPAAVGLCRHGDDNKSSYYSFSSPILILLFALYCAFSCREGQSLAPTHVLFCSPCALYCTCSCREGQSLPRGAASTRP